MSWSDGGGKVPAGLRPILGRAKVARLFAALGPGLAAGGKLTPALAHAVGGTLRGGVSMSQAEVNGSPSTLIWADSKLFAVFVPVIDGGKMLSSPYTPCPATPGTGAFP